MSFYDIKCLGVLLDLFFIIPLLQVYLLFDHLVPIARIH